MFSLSNQVLYRRRCQDKEAHNWESPPLHMNVPNSQVPEHWKQAIRYIHTDSMFIQQPSWLWFGCLCGFSTESKGIRLTETWDPSNNYVSPCKIESWYSTSSSSFFCESSKYESASPSPFTYNTKKMVLLRHKRGRARPTYFFCQVNGGYTQVSSQSIEGDTKEEHSTWSLPSKIFKPDEEAKNLKADCVLTE